MAPLGSSLGRSHCSFKVFNNKVGEGAGSSPSLYIPSGSPAPATGDSRDPTEGPGTTSPGIPPALRSLPGIVVLWPSIHPSVRLSIHPWPWQGHAAPQLQGLRGEKLAFPCCFTTQEPHIIRLHTFWGTPPKDGTPAVPRPRGAGGSRVLSQPPDPIRAVAPIFMGFAAGVGAVLSN